VTIATPTYRTAEEADAARKELKARLSRKALSVEKLSDQNHV